MVMPLPHLLLPPPPHTSPAGQCVPHWTTPPHLVSVTKPQSASSSSHVAGHSPLTPPLASPPSDNVAPEPATGPVAPESVPPELFKPLSVTSSGLPQPEP